MNSFERSHYVPILRWKEAERGALAQLDAQVSNCITPLVGLTPENFSKARENMSIEEIMYSVAGQLYQCCLDHAFYLDLLNIPPTLAGKCLEILGQYSNMFPFSLIPVTGLNRHISYTNSVNGVANKMKQGICLRLTRGDLQSSTLGQSVASFVSTLNLDKANTDLLVDCEIVDSSFPKFEDLCRLVPDIDRWRNFIIAGGAFPKDLSSYQKNDKHQIPRFEWLSWREQVKAAPSDTRLPNFSDYTVQYAQHIPRRPGHMNFSASIRYTSEDTWTLMRGAAVFRKDGAHFEQYPDIAMMLCGLPEYCGETFSMGDRYIKEIGLQKTETGSAPQWLQAGINHHMTFVVNQLAKL